MDRSLNASYAEFWASLLRRDDHEIDQRSSRRCISKYSQSSPQGTPELSAGTEKPCSQQGKDAQRQGRGDRDHRHKS